jgi:ubiquinone/menaquinone biosynthesis C-methylase UbiE
MDSLRLIPGMRILDVGCGCGNQTLDLAARLDTSSLVTGIDISEPMLALAGDLKDANTDSLGADVEFLLGDASESLFPDEQFDAIYSRFGVMFFADPTSAFASLRVALKPGGQLAFVCWQEPALNPFFTAPLQAALTVLPPQAPATPDAPGPFGLADKARVSTILDRAGFQSITVTPLALKLSVGDAQSFDEIFEELVQIGPAAALIAESDATLKAHARSAVYARLKDFYAPGSGVAFDANFWLVTAYN